MLSSMGRLLCVVMICFITAMISLCYVVVYGKARVCSYDSSYYCYECHENDEYYIPARIAQNWDFRKHKGDATQLVNGHCLYSP